MNNENSTTEILSEVLAEQLGQSLIHEDSEQFLAGIKQCMPDDTFDSMRGVLPTWFSILPKSSNNFSFATATQPKRNDACLCGSGKKLKKCCPQLLDNPIPKSAELFTLALSGLPEIDYINLAEKPNWNLTATNQFLQSALERDYLDAALILVLPLFADLPSFRNEHQELASTMLDILFETGENTLRIQLMEKLTQLKQAPSLQSIAHQRLAMICSQQGEEEQSHHHLQQAFRCDPNQVELPMAELSILGMIASEDEIKARAKFWQVRLKKKYHDHPALDFIEQIMVEGKALFDDYKDKLDQDSNSESNHEFDDLLENEFDGLFDGEIDFSDPEILAKLDKLADSDEIKHIKEIEDNHIRSLLALLQTTNDDNNYDIIKTANEAKFSLKKSLKPIYKQWLALYEEAGEEVNDIYAEEGEIMTDDDIDYHRWTMADPDWLDFLQQHPMLMNNFEVLLRLSVHIYQAPTPLEEDEILESGVLEEDLPELSNGRKLISIYKQRFATLAQGMMKILPKEFYLPRRFKGNDCFWQLADEHDIELSQSRNLEEQQNFLETLAALEKDSHSRIQNSLMLNYFQQGKLPLMLEFYGQLSKPSVAIILMVACAHQYQGNEQKAIETLASIKGKNRLTFMAFNQAIDEHNISPLFSGDIEYGIIPLCNLLLDSVNQPTIAQEEGRSDEHFISQSYLWLKGLR